MSREDSYFKSGKDHINWKGGRKKHNGYMLILKRDHPNTNKDGYVYEHRLVMEQSIGGYLTLKENVHHINGIKNDNRIENLQLFESLSKHRTHECSSKKYRDELSRKNKGKHFSPDTEFKKMVKKVR